MQSLECCPNVGEGMSDHKDLRAPWRTRGAQLTGESTQHVGPGGRTLLPFSPIKPRKQLLSIKQEQKHLGAGFLYSLQNHSNELFSMQILKHCFVLGKGFVTR